MRSGLIFSVSNRFTNRFLLCRMLATSARKMHRDGVSTSQCINSSLLALYEGPGKEPSRKEPPREEPPRQEPVANPPDVEAKDQQAEEETAQEAAASQS